MSVENEPWCNENMVYSPYTPSPNVDRYEVIRTLNRYCCERNCGDHFHRWKRDQVGAVKFILTLKSLLSSSKTGARAEASFMFLALHSDVAA